MLTLSGKPNTYYRMSDFNRTVDKVDKLPLQTKLNMTEW